MPKAHSSFLTIFTYDLTWRLAVNDYFNMVVMFTDAAALTKTLGDK
jgi:hypothetical protein